MNEIELKRQQRKYKRYRTLGTNNPFCRACGKAKWWVRFEDHHIGGKSFSDITILLCSDCHNEAHEMLNDLPPLPGHIDPRRASFIRILQGLKILLQMVVAQVDEIINWLLGDLSLPETPIPAAKQGEGDR
jgi:hypothetical protein